MLLVLHKFGKAEDVLGVLLLVAVDYGFVVHLAAAAMVVPR